jgi:8-oxo-dGTP pyrophosphatase MutT (NUDIX family)
MFDGFHSNVPMRGGTLRRGVVAVVRRNGRFLVIRRSSSVTAPGAYCFPGGGIEPGESESQALQRELHEELAAVDAVPLRRLWQCTTHRRVHLSWWLTRLAKIDLLVPNPSEVASVHWWSADDMLRCDRLLQSNRDFLSALSRGAFAWQ